MGNDFETDEFAELILEIDGTRLGSDTDGSLLHTAGVNGSADRQRLAQLRVRYDAVPPAGTRWRSASTTTSRRNSAETVEAWFDNDCGVTAAGRSPLAPGERISVVRDVAAFESRYGTGHRSRAIFQNDTGLSNSGETIKLDDATGSTILEFTYDDGGRLAQPGRRPGQLARRARWRH